MNKTEFLLSLEKKLVALPRHEIEVTQGFYSEMIDDRIEDGMREEDAVAAIGDVDAIVQNTLLELPPTDSDESQDPTKSQIEALGNRPDGARISALVPLGISFFYRDSCRLCVRLGGYYFPLCVSCRFCT